jgi:3-deoxy-D-manno-octulosonic-acid transferase
MIVQLLFCMELSMRFVIDFAYVLAGVVISPLVLYRALRYKRYRAGWGHRFGKVTRRHPEKKCVWIHAVSVGEVNAARTIVKELLERLGDVEIVVSTTTDTGYALAQAVYADEHSVFYFPLDFSPVMRRVFERIRPAVCLLMELEVWPNFVDVANKANVPVVIVNGRVTERSCRRYKRIRPLARRIFQKLSLILAQTEQYAERFVEIGAQESNVVVTGSLKYDTAQIADKVDGADELARQLGIGDERLWVAGATGNDEEKILIDVYKRLREKENFKDLRFVIVPRKPERFDEVAQVIADAGFEYARYSEIKGTDKCVSADVAVILGDTMGDLRKFYSLATIIFVGRSLVPMGGSDMIEAAALGKCTIFGPHAFNFTQTVDALVAGQGALLVQDDQELFEAMQECLSNADFAKKTAQKGRDIIVRNQGATVKTIDHIQELLNTVR